MKRLIQSVMPVIAIVLIIGSISTGCQPATPVPQLKSTAREVVRVRWCPTAVGSSSHQHSIIVAALMEKYSDWVKLSVAPGASTTAITGWLADGRVDIVASSSNYGVPVTTGTGMWKGRPPFKEVRIMWNILPLDLLLVVPKDSPIKSIYDLKGKRVSMAGKGALLHEPAFWLLGSPDFADAGSLYQPGEVDVRHFSVTEAASEALRNGHVDAMMLFATTYLPHLSELAMLKDVKSIRLPEEVFKKLEEHFPGALVRRTAPKGMYRGMDEDLPTVSTTGIWLTTSRMRDDVMYEITKVYWDHFDELQEMLKAGEELRDPAYALGFRWAPFHPGCERYFKERGWLK